MTIGNAIARSWTDEAFKKQLMTDPHAALREVGVTVPEGIKLMVVENTADTQYLVLPAPPAHPGDVSMDELARWMRSGDTSGTYNAAMGTYNAAAGTYSAAAGTYSAAAGTYSAGTYDAGTYKDRK
ncbi:NHLP leader peptide family RiPP precursor [Sinorhizobium meliloti]|uniref:NHLP leader peptide family RiPP precursor n=1 Tax=Rhizobium meliloti TaxID=382 RepID=UPI000FD7C9F4|nr:NHLP leader peptide family RiPP precursor [Sinorhizobium meliloti]RVQ13203.1 NHLP leader peptide family natural product precursor [Sinorhizobium meliloti]